MKMINNNANNLENFAILKLRLLLHEYNWQYTTSNLFLLPLKVFYYRLRDSEDPTPTINLRLLL